MAANMRSVLTDTEATAIVGKIQAFHASTPQGGGSATAGRSRERAM
jgi:hypothetical protein